MDDDQEIQLALRFHDGDPKAFAEIYELFYPRLYKFGFAITNNPDETEDILSITFSGLFKKYEDFNLLSNIKAFLYMAVRNYSLNYLRNEQRRNSHTTRLIHSLQSESTDHAEIDGKLLAELNKLVGKLPEQKRKVITLLFYHDMKYKEVAAKLNISPNTVREYRQSAIDQLKKALRGAALTLVVYFLIHCLLNH